MSTDTLIQLLRRWNDRSEPKPIDDMVAEMGHEAWNRLCDGARNQPGSFSAQALEWLWGWLDRQPRSVMACLLILAGKDEKRRKEIYDQFRAAAARHPEQALVLAGYWLHEFNVLIDDWTIEFALKNFDLSPEGAWGIVDSASSYRPEFLPVKVMDAFEKRVAARPSQGIRAMLQFAGRMPKRRAGLVRRALKHLDKYPVEGLEGIAAAQLDARSINASVIDAVALRISHNPEKAWTFFERAAYETPKLLDDRVLDTLEKSISGKSWYSMLRTLIDKDKKRAPALVARFARTIPVSPEQGVDAAYYLCQNNPPLATRELVTMIGKHAESEAYKAIQAFWALLTRRPELVGETELRAVIRVSANAANYAFGYIRDVSKARPDLTPLCTIALFECFVHEPAGRARPEMINDLVAIADASHIRTSLEETLRSPANVGSKRARALLSIMFNQRLRSRQYVLMEALRAVSNLITRRPRKVPHDRPWTILWDFLMFIIDVSTDDSVSTAFAERFLEGAFQLSYLTETSSEYEDFVGRFSLEDSAPATFPRSVAWLNQHPELVSLYSTVLTLAQRFGEELRLAPLGEFDRRMMAAEIERNAVDTQIDTAQGERRRRLEERRNALDRKIGWWLNPAYAAACSDPAAEAKLSPEAREFLHKEKHDLEKRLRDALRVEAVRMGVAAVEGARVRLYRAKLSRVLDRDVDISKVEPSILPAFLFFGSVGSRSKNREYLAKMIEDRIAGRPHDWLRNDPPVKEWAAKVEKEIPGVRIDRWRAAFEMKVNYRAKDAAAEKKRRVSADLAQARTLFESMKVLGFKSGSFEELRARLSEVRTSPPKDAELDEAKLQEIEMNLERIRIAEMTPDSDFEGALILSVETDPFQVLFMGEYGFASCLSLRGSNAWAAVSNAIDLDKAIVWAKEPNGNVVGRRLLALTPRGILTYRTYANRHGLALDPLFDKFVEAYCAHVGAPLTHGEGPGPLLSDAWYDDRAL